jgi:hypothetical protein
MENEFSPCCTYGLITAFPISNYVFFEKCNGAEGLTANTSLVDTLIGNRKFEIGNF